MATEVDVEPHDTAERAADEDVAESSGEPEHTERDTAPELGRRNGARIVVVTLLVAALGFAGWSGWSWYSTATSDDLNYAQARDAALEAGREALAVITSMDYRHVRAGLREWKRVSTGQLHERLSRTGTETVKALRAGGAVATGEVLAAGISELDAHEGTATMLAVVKITIEKQDSPRTSKRNRFAVRLRRTEEGWKISALNPVPVGGTSGN